jgi:branched-chain amino acid transport system permease protein
MIILQIILSGIVSGSLYSLFALGLVMIFKATKVANFAQGEMMTISGYMALLFLHLTQGLGVVAFLLAILFTCVVGLIIERIAYRPLIKAPVISIVIATLGISITLKGGMRVIWGPHVHPFPPINIFGSVPINIRGLIITPHNLFVIFITSVLMMLLFCFFKYLKIGKAMRAVAQDQEASSLMGIGVKKYFSLTWTMSSGLGAIAGVLIASLIYLEPDMGNVLLIKAFAAAILGGFVSLPGTVVGGLMLGILETLVGFYISTKLVSVTAFMVLILVLFFKPEGLFGVYGSKKV